MWCTRSTVLRRCIRRAADPPTDGRVAISDVSVAGLDETASLLAGRGADAQRVELDVGDRVAVGEYAAMIAEHFDVVHQFCNNAGIGFSRSALETEYADDERLSAVNLRGVIHGTKPFLPRLVASGDGHLIDAR